MAENDRCPACGGFRGLPRMLHEDVETPKECSDPFHSQAEVLEFKLPGKAQGEAAAPADAPAIPAPTEQSQESMRKRPVCPYCGQEGKIIGSLTDLGPMKIMVI